MLYPKPGLAKLLRERPSLAPELFALLQETTREKMAEMWRTHAGGLYKIEPGELAKVRFASSRQWLKDLFELDRPLVEAEMFSELVAR
jgi:hypothetical protein